MAIDFSTAGSNAKSWPDLIATIQIHDGAKIEDVDLASLDWSAVRSRGYQMKHGLPYARTRGTTTFASSVAFYDSGWDAFIAGISTQASSLGIPIYDVGFDLIGKRKAVDSDSVDTIILVDCALNEASASYAEGDDPHQKSAVIDVMRIIQIVDGAEVQLG